LQAYSGEAVFLFLSLKLYGVEWAESCLSRLTPGKKLPVSIEKEADRAAVVGLDVCNRGKCIASAMRGTTFGPVIISTLCANSTVICILCLNTK